MLEKIYLIHHTHYDIGFTDLADEVERQQLNYLDQAVALAEADPEFHWTIESASLLRNYLDFRPQQQIDKMIRFLKNGQIEVAAYDMQMLTETASFPELMENVSRAAALGRKYGFPVECAILDDIGGLTGEMPLLMNKVGIRYLIAGCGAYQTELPWADLPHLFYLKSNYGGKILVWNLGIDRTETSSQSRYPSPVYGIGSIFLGYRAYPEYLNEYDLGIKMPMADDTESHKLTAAEVYNIFTQRLDKEQYPYREILMQYGGDNRNPAPRLADLVRKLNASGNYPEIKLTTPSGYFRMMEEKYGPTIPEISGILTDPWNIRINAVPTVLKKYRHAQDLYQKSLLHGMSDEHVLENMMLIADHTLGLNTWGWQKNYEANGKSLTASCFDRFRESWQRKADYASSAYRDAVKLLRKRAVKANYSNQQAVIIRNHSPHLVSGNVELYLGSYAAKLLSLTDEKGEQIPRQLIGQNRWMLYVKNVPALGSLKLQPEFSDSYDDIPTPMSDNVLEQLTTDFFKIGFSPEGTLRSVCTADGTSILKGVGDELLCEELYDSGKSSENCGLKPSTDRHLITLGNSSAKVIADGELFTDLLLFGTLADGKAERRLRVWKKLNRLDLSIRLDLQEHVEKRCYYVSFPFDGKGGRIRFDQNVGVAELKDLLPGSMLDLFFCSRYTALETEGFTAILCCPDAPIVEFDGMHTAKWRKALPLIPENNHVYGLLYNNICNTDAPAWQNILDTFQYSLFIENGKFEYSSAHNAWHSISALEAELSHEMPDPGITPVPLQYRVHCDASGKCYLEDPEKGTLTDMDLRNFSV